jgi:hypothetical protein
LNQRWAIVEPSACAMCNIQRHAGAVLRCHQAEIQGR